MKINPRRAIIGLSAALATTAHAIEIDTGNPDIVLRWDNTVKYSAAVRVLQRDPPLTQVAAGANPNADDGDNNFRRGFVSNRLDIFSEADLTYRKQFGARVSGAAWYDSIYNRSTDNQSNTANHLPSTDFPSETRRVMGRDAEVLDAFAWGNFELGDVPASVRLGRHTLLWGESLFFGSNGIAGGQAPVDLVKLQNVPNSQFKETIRPTAKLSAQATLNSVVSVAAYYGFEWERTRLLPSGSYLSTNDFIGPGGENFKAGPALFPQVNDVKPPSSGQGGGQVRLHVAEIDIGLYAIRYHAFVPSNVVLISTPRPGKPPAPLGYSRFYHEGIRAYGVSFAKSLASDWSIAGEASYRQNTPLASAGQRALSPIAFDNSSNPPYAVGESAHVQFSWTKSFGPTFISREALFLGEIAWNTRTRFTSGEAFADPNASRSAFAVRMVYGPTYRQVVSGLDLTPTFGGGATDANSSAVGSPFGTKHSGDLNVGLSAVYLDRWFASMNYVHYVGPLQWQLQKDRDFVNVSLRTTF